MGSTRHRRGTILGAALIGSAALAAFPAAASAHRGALGPGEFDALAWDWSNPTVPFVLATATLYGRGLVRLWQRAGVGRGVSLPQAGCFAASLFLLLGALISPLDSLGASLFFAHMGQHLTLTIVVAPLLVYGKADVAMLWALPPGPRRNVATGLHNVRRTRLVQAMSRPAIVVGGYSATLWLWHVPPLYDAVETSLVLHALEHASLLGFASLFWWRVLDLLNRPPHAQLRALPFIFAFMLSALTLGATLTFAGQAWFSAHEATAPAWGFTPAEDQQLGGLLMLMPATLVHLGALVLVFSRAYAGTRDAPQHAPRQSP